MSARINVLVEFDRIGIVPQQAGRDTIKVCCPFHDDAHPSLSVNTDTAQWFCHVCNFGGDFAALLAGILKTDRQTALADLSQRYSGLIQDKTVNAQLVEIWHSQINDAGVLLQELRNRGVSDDVIRKRRLGYDKELGRITIPIPNELAQWVNVRKYLPGAPGSEKMRNTKGFSKPMLYPIEQLKYSDILLTGGEVKAIVAAEQLNPHNIGAITGTISENNWSKDFTPKFAGKRVWVCLDIDETGRKWAEQYCRLLARVAEWVGLVHLPLDPERHPKGDINDFIATEHGELLPLLLDCPPYVPAPLGASYDTTDLPHDISLGAAMSAEYTAQRVAVKAVIAAVDLAPYIIPAKVDVLCDKAQDFCGACPVYYKEPAEAELSPEHPALLAMVNAPQAQQRTAIIQAVGIPEACTVCRFEVREYFNAEETRVSPQLEITSRAAERVMQPAVVLSSNVEPNETYILTGRMHPHPLTQQSTLLISEAKPAQDALSTYNPPTEQLEALRVFQPDSEDWTLEAISAKLNTIYEDIEANVTQIYQRKRLHLAYDLAYHSPLLLEFDGKPVNGWLQVLVIGDSGQGKSEAIKELISHYGLGEKVDCKNASVAGLLGGLQQLGKRWFVSWGVIPSNDKRLVVLEELKGASYEVISRLTDMRSSGQAEIPKIEKKKTHARTRLIALSNPRGSGDDSIQLSTYSFGVEAVRELIGSLEDVRRFDAVFMAADGDVDAGVINQLRQNRPQVPHVYTSELCRALILWTWTRSREQIYFLPETTEYILGMATELCGMFSDAIPIVDRGSMRLKLARLSAALAARTFCTADYQTLCVLPCHVEYICNTLIAEYSRSVFGYADYTAALQASTKLTDTEMIKNAIASTKYPLDFVAGLLRTDAIDMAHIKDFCDVDTVDGQRLLSLLVRKGAMMRSGREYRKTAPFIELLKTIQIDGSLDINQTAPDFLGNNISNDKLNF